MESSDPSTDWLSQKIGSCEPEASMLKRYRNWAICALCVASLAVYGLLIYREIRLESRIANLEARLERQEQPDVLFQRLKEEVRRQIAEKQRELDFNQYRGRRDVAECNCPPGLPGKQGPPGKKGKKGRKGDVGPQGNAGLAGKSGFPGPIGMDGPKGEPGRTGDKGEKGDVGNSGFDVISAVKGLQEQGHNISAQSIIQLKGEPGAPGPPGPVGSQGAEGPPGHDGRQGIPGDNGPPGEKGSPGSPGSSGPPGITGAVGPKGDKGDKGDRTLTTTAVGEAFSTGVFEGPPGPPGPPGQRGEPGPSGMPGLNGTDGEAGIQGPPGMPIRPKNIRAGTFCTLFRHLEKVPVFSTHPRSSNILGISHL